MDLKKSASDFTVLVFTSEALIRGQKYNYEIRTLKHSYPRLVRTPADLEDESLNFKPEMTHQIYGDNENIFGYKGLQVQN